MQERLAAMTFGTATVTVLSCSVAKSFDVRERSRVEKAKHALRICLRGGRVGDIVAGPRRNPEVYSGAPLHRFPELVTNRWRCQRVPLPENQENPGIAVQLRSC